MSIISTTHPRAISFFFFLISVLICPLIFACSPNLDNLIVDTKTGKVRGQRRTGGGVEFLGIPYAQPPLGTLRWHEPLPSKPWTEIRDARDFGAPCAQPIIGDWNRLDSTNSKEDCLYLNVVTPQWPAKTPLPVMFWIHGGVNAGGTASSPLFKDGTLVNHEVILVSVNYRLGIFGFFSHPELTRESTNHASGNYGLMDQIAGLRWVHDNISAFGGDPNNVTVFGQSAGGQDTSLLMTSPLARGLFHRAIVQSGSALNPPCPTLAESEKSGEKLAKALAPSSNALKDLRQLSTQELLKSVGVQDPTLPPLLGPNIDGWVIPRSPDKVFAAGQQLPLPLIIGTTSREFGLPAPVGAVRKFISDVTGDLSDQALSLYGLAGDGEGTKDELYGSAGDQWFADLLFRCPVTTQAAWHSTINRSTYEYQLEHVIQGQNTEGAVHSSDLPYVFGFYPDYLKADFGEIDHKLVDVIETYWTNFAKTGNPNSAQVPNWPEFGPSQSLIRFTEGGSVTVSSGLRRSYCDLLRQVYKRRMESTN